MIYPHLYSLSTEKIIEFELFDCLSSGLICFMTLQPMDYIALQAPLSTEFSRQEYWSGLPFLPPGDLPEPGIKPPSPAAPAFTGRFLTTKPTEKSLCPIY